MEIRFGVFSGAADLWDNMSKMDLVAKNWPPNVIRRPGCVFKMLRWHWRLRSVQRAPVTMIRPD